MSDSPLTKDKIAAAIEKAPALADVLKKLAGKVARGRWIEQESFSSVFEAKRRGR